MQPKSTHSSRIIRDLRQLRDIARREHGPQAWSTRHIEASLRDAEQEQGGSAAQQRGKPSVRHGRSRAEF